MSIPESDHQMVSNLIAFVSMVIAAIAVIFSLLESRRSKQLAAKAEHLANGANARAEETLLILKSQPWMKNQPDISLRFQVGKISRISSASDIITLHFINESPGMIIIDKVFIGHPFKGHIEAPTSLTYWEELKIRIVIDDVVSSPLSLHPREGSEDIEAIRQLVENELMKITITIQMVNELHHHYEIDYNFDPLTERFEATPVQMSYRASKIGTE